VSDNKKDAWSTLETKTLLEFAPYVRVEKEKVKTNRGQIVDDYYRVILPSFAACVPFTQDGDIITLWQYKHGSQSYSLTFPAGFVESGEDPAIACERELLEETGYKPDGS